MFNKTQRRRRHSTRLPALTHEGGDLDDIGFVLPGFGLFRAPWRRERETGEEERKRGTGVWNDRLGRTDAGSWGLSFYWRESVRMALGGLWRQLGCIMLQWVGDERRQRDTIWLCCRLLQCPISPSLVGLPHFFALSLSSSVSPSLPLSPTQLPWARLVVSPAICFLSLCTWNHYWSSVVNFEKVGNCWDLQGRRCVVWWGRIGQRQNATSWVTALVVKRLDILLAWLLSSNNPRKFVC